MGASGAKISADVLFDDPKIPAVVTHALQIDRVRRIRRCSSDFAPVASPQTLLRCSHASIPTKISPLGLG